MRERGAKGLCTANQGDPSGPEDRCGPDLAAPDLPVFGREQANGGSLCRLDLAAALGPSSVARLVLPHQGGLCLGVESHFVALWKPWHAGRVPTVILQGKALEGET